MNYGPNITCKECGVPKGVESFRVNRNGKDKVYRRRVCAVCDLRLKRQRYATTYHIRAKEYRDRVADRKHAQDADYQARHGEVIRAKKRSLRGRLIGSRVYYIMRYFEVSTTRDKKKYLTIIRQIERELVKHGWEPRRGQRLIATAALREAV